MRISKLSKTQTEVLELMESGWQLAISTSAWSGGGGWMQQGGIGKGGEARNVSVATIAALDDKGFITVERDGFPQRIYKRTAKAWK